MKVEFLQIEPTTRCNFTCGFCCGRQMTQSDLREDTFARVLDALPDLRHIELLGEGEPLLHPRFFDMARQALKRGLRVSFITNGSLLSPSVVDQILGLGFWDVSISLESADPEVFRNLRGGKLEKVIEGVRRLVAARDARKLKRPAIGFALTVLRRTLGDLSAIRSLYRDLGLDGGIGIQLLQGMEPYVRCYDEEMSAQRFRPEEIRQVRATIKNSGLRELDVTMREQGFYQELFSGWTPSSGTCPWLERGLYVNRDGFVTGCCTIKEAEHAFGRIGVDSLSTILKRRDRTRRELAKPHIPASCRGCRVAEAIYASNGPSRKYLKLALALDKNRITKL